jgi:hypothetical protein
MNAIAKDIRLWADVARIKREALAKAAASKGLHTMDTPVVIHRGPNYVCRIERKKRCAADPRQKLAGERHQIKIGVFLNSNFQP